MEIDFTKKQEKYIHSQVEQGKYPSASEFLIEAVRLHELQREKALEELRAEIGLGWDSPVIECSVEDILEDRIQAFRANS